MPTLSAEVASALKDAEVEGNTLRLTGQLERPTYTAVNKVLEALGGKWNRKAGAHVFPGDPAEKLREILDGGAYRDPKADESWFRTPDDLADYIVRNFTELHDADEQLFVLEPSAGDGSLVRAVERLNRKAWITAIEPNPDRYKHLLRGHGQIHAFNMTFEKFAADPELNHAEHNAVVMNPPFTLPRNPTAWIDHVLLAYDLLKVGGRLTSIVPMGASFRFDRKHTAIRDLYEAHGGTVELEPSAFSESGTDVRTCVLWIDKPEPMELGRLI